MELNNEELRRLQNIEVNILKEYIRICNELGLRYYVLGGTLLGAVRHKGFIPWDDDIDVGMLREDYEQFIVKAPSMLPEGLFLQNHSTDKEYCKYVTKIRNVHTTFIEKECRAQNICHGVFVDVFPLDNYPRTRQSIFRLKIKRKILEWRIGKMYQWDEKNSVKILLKKAMYACLCLIWPNVKDAITAREILFSSFPHTGLVANFNGAWGEKEIVPMEWYGEGCNLIFEGLAVKAPREYQKWLTQVYGDYMTLPPEEKRVAHHDTSIIDLDRPYTEYI